MKKISIIGTVGIPANYGGFETLVEYLTSYLSSKFDITVVCSSKKYINKLKSYNGAKLEYINLNANGSQSILYDIVSIFKLLRKSDTLLILGVSGCLVLPIIKLISNVKIVVNIDGLEWKRDKWNKLVKFFLKVSEKIAVKYAHEIIGDNKAIVDYIKSEYNSESHLIAYGADHVSREIIQDNDVLKYPFLDKPYAFKVCRIEPENNIHLILEAFSKINSIQLVIVGNWLNSPYGVKLKSKYSSENVLLLDPIYDQKILNTLRSNCQFYIHGHSAGGTNPSLVEAMNLGLPILAYDVEYNRHTTGNKAFYFKDSDDIISILSSLNSSELSSVGDLMLKYAKENYIWSLISDKYSKLF